MKKMIPREKKKAKKNNSKAQKLVRLKQMNLKGIVEQQILMVKNLREMKLMRMMMKRKKKDHVDEELLAF